MRDTEGKQAMNMDKNPIQKWYSQSGSWNGSHKKSAPTGSHP